MNLLITEISKYIMLLCLWVYLIESVFALVHNNGDKRTGRYLRQYIYIFLIHTLGMITLYLKSEDIRYVFLYLIEAGVLFAFSRLALLCYKGINRMILNHMCMFLSIGFVMLSRISYVKAVRQFKIICFALIIFMIIPVIIRKLEFIKNLWILYGGLGILALSAVWILGDTVNGSKLSFQIMGLTFQPSEFVKILFAFFIAGIIYEVHHFGKVMLSAILAAIYVLTLVASKDLGSALIFFCMYIVMIYTATGKIRYLILGTIGGAIAAFGAYFLFKHVQVRIAVWLDPWTDIDNTGYQLTQSLFAIGTGGWLGMGLMGGMPTSIPFVDEDFMFSAIAEEMGVFFGITLILLCLVAFLQFLQFALRIKDSFYRLVANGIATAYGVQVLLTIGGGTRFIPLTGVTLPLISNGGSSATAVIIMFAIMAGISLVQVDEEDLGIDEYEDFFDEDGYLIEEYETEFLEKENEIKYRKRSMITQCVLMSLLYFGMIGNIVAYMLNDSQIAINNSYNQKRQEILAANTLRGTIYAADGSVLAQTIIDNNGNERREYPYGEMFSHIVGYSVNGRAGIENEANMYLIQSSTSLASRVQNEMDGVKNPGDCVYTSLNPELQQIAYDSLGVYRGAVIVTEAKTGRILAMVSKPAYDPNTIERDWNDLINDKSSTVLLNRATQGLYPPGSTFKIFTALEYIRENPENYDSYHYTCNGFYKSGDERINCYHGSVHGALNLTSSFAKSCNSSFANIGMSLNRSEFANTLISMLFNSELPLTMEYKQSHITMRMDMSDEQIMQTSIGQWETLVTPVHLNMVTQSIANNGVMLKPYVIDSIVSAEGNNIKVSSASEYGRVMSEDEAQILTKLMIQVVENGTASKLSGQSYTAAGKTGSAEYSDVKGQSHAWFTGFAPAEDPEIVVTVIVEGAGSGGDYAAPIARRIFSAYLE